MITLLSSPPSHTLQTQPVNTNPSSSNLFTRNTAAMSDAPSTNPPYTGMSLSKFPLELLADIVEPSVQPNFYFMSLIAVDAEDCQADCPTIPTPFPFTDHAHWQIDAHQPPPPPIALTCRILYAEWVRQKRKGEVLHKFACGLRAHVNLDRDIFILRIDGVDRPHIRSMGYTVFWRTMRLGIHSLSQHDRSLVRNVALEPLYFKAGGSNFEIRHLIEIFPAMETLHLNILDVPAAKALPPHTLHVLELTPFPDTLDAGVPGGRHKRVADLEIDARKPRRLSAALWWDAGREHPAIGVQVHLNEADRQIRVLGAKPRDNGRQNSATWPADPSPTFQGWSSAGEHPETSSETWNIPQGNIQGRGRPELNLCSS